MTGKYIWQRDNVKEMATDLRCMCGTTKESIYKDFTMLEPMDQEFFDEIWEEIVAEGRAAIEKAHGSPIKWKN